ncbi:MAG: hypothetical protein ACREF1_08070 [Acetobacteraceae bacterium]
MIASLALRPGRGQFGHEAECRREPFQLELRLQVDHAAIHARLARPSASISISAMLCVSRFAHALKLLGRQMVGSFLTAEDIERRLGRWLTDYVNASTSPGPEMRARYPLVAASVAVRELPGKPGVYGCVIHLQPQFQLEGLAATFRLVTELTAPGAQR